jgi:hypothetical protein
VLEEKLKLTIRSICRKFLSKGVHDNARSHTATNIQKLKFETTNHFLYSPDLAPSDYHVCGTLKGPVRGQRFHSKDDWKETVKFWLQKQANSFFYWNAEVCRKMWKVHCKGRWLFFKMAHPLHSGPLPLIQFRNHFSQTVEPVLQINLLTSAYYSFSVFLIAFLV